MKKYDVLINSNSYKFFYSICSTKEEHANLPAFTNS